MMLMRKTATIALIISLVIGATFVLPGVKTAEAYLGDRTLNHGMTGYDVIQLQKDLGYLGYKIGTVDGMFGPQTLSAVKEFQSQNGMQVDGIVGKNTANAVIKQVSTPATTNTPAAQNVSRGGYTRLSSKDIYDLARLVHGEARGEPFSGQVAVASVVLNRMDSSKFGTTVQEVIFQPGAFTAVNDKQFYLEPNATSFKAVEAALKGWDPTGGAIYYWNPQTATNKWIWSRPIINKIGKHVFAL